MLCKDIITRLEELCPAECAMEWDNVGLLAGRREKEVKRVYIALDATDEVVEEAVQTGADMLVTHHPLIFSGLKQITDGDFIGKRVLRLLQNDISYYAVHTNYDVRRMGVLSCGKLGFEKPQVLECTRVGEDGVQEGIGCIAEIKETELLELAGQVKDTFRLDSVRIFGSPKQKIRKAAICPGSGKSVIPEAIKKQADVLITGDIGHHEGIDSVACGMAVIDAGHYGIEHIFTADMERLLKENFPELEIKTAPLKSPFINI